MAKAETRTEYIARAKASMRAALRSQTVSEKAEAALRLSDVTRKAKAAAAKAAKTN